MTATTGMSWRLAAATSGALASAMTFVVFPDSSSVRLLEVRGFTQLLAAEKITAMTISFR
ncbi:hypothetical protein [Streptomyces sp. CJ_13]|uniref:hypothetical protein n=1 Tax=Streptomyces sp. CJ_13 TaxID=2724943 RepID=UPI001BDCE6C0|nr:hypothetical protein [Streptomyces sp. CJ_13]